ncbi:hypothetical protein [Nonomuraea sp. B19D2]|uniref:hypothetical protein n=1 Tax=Nonomuraea sp. B19D2 TaxID=3159561 RepID=UPI0032DA8E43
MPLVEPPPPLGPYNPEDPFWQEVDATMERARVAAGARFIITLNREEYERACAELELSPMTDEGCFSPEMRRGPSGPPDLNFVETISWRLAQARHNGITRELREERRQLSEELARRFPHGMSRRHYEEYCADVGIQPAPDEAIRGMAAEYLAREEIEDLPDFNLFVANFRDKGIRTGGKAPITYHYRYTGTPDVQGDAQQGTGQ